MDIWKSSRQDPGKGNANGTASQANALKKEIEELREQLAGMKSGIESSKEADVAPQNGEVMQQCRDQISLWEEISKICAKEKYKDVHGISELKRKYEERTKGAQKAHTENLGSDERLKTWRRRQTTITARREILSTKMQELEEELAKLENEDEQLAKELAEIGDKIATHQSKQEMPQVPQNNWSDHPQLKSYITKLIYGVVHAKHEIVDEAVRSLGECGLQPEAPTPQHAQDSHSETKHEPSPKSATRKKLFGTPPRASGLKSVNVDSSPELAEDTSTSGGRRMTRRERRMAQEDAARVEAEEEMERQAKEDADFKSSAPAGEETERVRRPHGIGLKERVVRSATEKARENQHLAHARRSQQNRESLFHELRSASTE